MPLEGDGAQPQPCAPIDVDHEEGRAEVMAAPKAPKREPQQAGDEPPRKTSKKAREPTNLELLNSMQKWQESSEQRFTNLVQKSRRMREAHEHDG